MAALLEQTKYLKENILKNSSISDATTNNDEDDDCFTTTATPAAAAVITIPRSATPPALVNSAADIAAADADEDESPKKSVLETLLQTQKQHEESQETVTESNNNNNVNNNNNFNHNSNNNGINNHNNNNNIINNNINNENEMQAQNREETVENSNLISPIAVDVKQQTISLFDLNENNSEKSKESCGNSIDMDAGKSSNNCCLTDVNNLGSNNELIIGLDDKKQHERNDDLEDKVQIIENSPTTNLIKNSVNDDDNGTTTPPTTYITQQQCTNLLSSSHTIDEDDENSLIERSSMLTPTSELSEDDRISLTDVQQQLLPIIPPPILVETLTKNIDIHPIANIPAPETLLPTPEPTPPTPPLCVDKLSSHLPPPLSPLMPRTVAHEISLTIGNLTALAAAHTTLCTVPIRCNSTSSIDDNSSKLILSPSPMQQLSSSYEPRTTPNTISIQQQQQQTEPLPITPERSFSLESLNSETSVDSNDSKSSLKLAEVKFSKNGTLERQSSNQNQQSQNATGVVQQTGLQVLVLWNNRLTRDSSKHVSKLLAETTSIEILNVGLNVLSNDFLTNIKSSLTANTSLTSIGLQSAHLTCTGVKTLADILEFGCNATLQRIDLRDNHLQVAGLTAINDVLKSNKTVTQIDLDDVPRRAYVSYMIFVLNLLDLKDILANTSLKVWHGRGILERL